MARMDVHALRSSVSVISSTMLLNRPSITLNVIGSAARACLARLTSMSRRYSGRAWAVKQLTRRWGRVPAGDSILVAARAAELVPEDREQQDHPFHDLLPVRLHVDQDQAVVERPDQEEP